MSGRHPSGQTRQDALLDAERRLDQLQELLTRELEWVQQGNLSAVEQVCKQTERCVQRIAANRILDDANLEGRRRRLESMYKELCLILAAQRQETFDVLNTVRRGKKVLRTYGNHTLRT